MSPDVCVAPQAGLQLDGSGEGSYPRPIPGTRYTGQASYQQGEYLLRFWSQCGNPIAALHDSQPSFCISAATFSCCCIMQVFIIEGITT